jgi:hypothetical protein
MVFTYKGGTAGDIPVAQVLIKCRSRGKHNILAGENNEKQDWLRALACSRVQQISNALDLESSFDDLKTEPNK